MHTHEKKKSEFGRAAWEATKWFSRKSAKLIRDSTLLARPISRKETVQLSKVEPFLEPKELNRLTLLLKQGKAQIKVVRFGWSFLISGKDLLPKIIFVMPEKRRFNPDQDIEVKDRLWIEQLDKKIRHKFFDTRFREFAERASNAVAEFIAPNLIGLAEVKQAAALQLFSTEPVHLLLLGDPGTGKTDVLRSVSELSPISSFGLGSGTSGAGLAVTVQGKKVLPGLLPMAHNGTCCIDELNLMKKEDYAALYNAMEKGFITYDKGGKHYTFDALIKVVATGNPIGDRFESDNIAEMKKQLPFDSALLSRFHLVFLVKRASLERFSEIAEKIISEEKVKVKHNDKIFIQKYVRHASKLNPELPKELADKVKDFVTELKSKESELPLEITPRTVVGITRLLKASARMDLRNTVEAKDLEKVFKIVNSAYQL